LTEVVGLRPRADRNREGHRTPLSSSRIEPITSTPMDYKYLILRQRITSACYGAMLFVSLGLDILWSPILLSMSRAPSPTLKLFRLVPGDVPVDATSALVLNPAILAYLPAFGIPREPGFISRSSTDDPRRTICPGRGISRLAALKPGKSAVAIFGLMSSDCPGGRDRRSARPSRVTPTTLPPLPLPPTPSCMPLLNLFEEAEEHTLDGLLPDFAAPATSG